MGLCEVVITLKGCVTLNAGKTQPDLPSELRDRQGYTEKHCFKTTNKHKTATTKLFLSCSFYTPVLPSKKGRS